jgi:hypothetical protein
MSGSLPKNKRSPEEHKALVSMIYFTIWYAALLCFHPNSLILHQADERGIEKQPVSFAETVVDASLVVIAGTVPRFILIQALTFIAFLGADTTATVLSSLVFYLLDRPSAYRRLQAEVDKFTLCGTPSLEHLPEMNYLEACV